MLWESVAFQSNTPVGDGLGGYTDSYSTQFTFRCQVVEKQQDRILENGSLIGLKTYEIKVRKSATETDTITQDWELVYRTRTLRIMSIEQSQDRKWYMIKAIEK